MFEYDRIFQTPYWHALDVLDLESHEDYPG